MHNPKGDKIPCAGSTEVPALNGTFVATQLCGRHTFPLI